MAEESKEDAQDRLDAELIEAAVLSKLPENCGKIRGVRITTGDGSVVTALFMDGRCLGIILDERRKDGEPI